MQYLQIELGQFYTRLYTLTMNPKHYQSDSSIHAFVNGAFIISKTTFELVGDKLVFESVDGRNAFLKDNDLHIRHMKIKGKERWYLLHGEAELATMQISDEYDVRVK